MHISVWFSGPAGSGVNTAGFLLAKLLSQKGYMVLGDKEYASIIKGDNNSFFLYISDDGKPFISKHIDYFLAYDNYAIEKNGRVYQLKNTVNIHDQSCKYKNTFTFWMSLALLGLTLEEGKRVLFDHLEERGLLAKTQEQNQLDLQAGYDYALAEKYSLPLSPLPEEKAKKSDFTFWNALISKGAIDGGLEFFSSYPMTPASSITDGLLEEESVVYFQGEDEIAVSMAMLGAKFAGKRAMCATSGWGFALMSESISFSHQAEIGGVYILVQRDGPSTGTPTFTGQYDINYALNASFGEVKPIVIVPSTFSELYTYTNMALNRSDQYQHPVILLSDKFLSEGYQSIDMTSIAPLLINRGKKYKKSEGEDQFARYEATDDGISPYAVPGEEHSTFIISSYEHNRYGVTNEDPSIKEAMMHKRAQKMITFQENEFNQDYAGYEIINPEAQSFYVSLGGNRFAIEQKIKGRSDLGLIVIKQLAPFDQRLKYFFDEHELQIAKLIFVEMNYSGMLEELVCKECRLLRPEWEKKIEHHRKFWLYPIFQEELPL